MIRRRNFLVTAGSFLIVGARADGLSAAVVDKARLGSAWVLPRAQDQTLMLTSEDAVRLDEIPGLIAEWHLPPTATLTIALARGEYRLVRTLRMQHPHGRQIRIVGDHANPQACRLVWAPGMDGVFVGEGATLGLLDGVMLVREVADNNNGAKDNACAVVASDGGIIACGSAVVSDGFYYGFHARRGGVVRCDGTRVRRAGDAGYFAWHGGHLSARRTQSELASDSKLGLGSGYVAEFGGTIDATGATATSNLLAGFTALSGGSITASNALAERNDHYGLFAAINGSIVAHDAIARGNRVAQTFVKEGGQISGNRLILS